MKEADHQASLSELLHGTAQLTDAAQLGRLTAVVRAARGVPFHRERLAGLAEQFDFAQWGEIPELCADDLHAGHNRLLHPDAPEPALADATGGTHGPPTPFFTTRRQRLVGEAIHRVHAGEVASVSRPKVVVLDPDPMTPNAEPLGYWERRRWRKHGGLSRIACAGLEQVTMDRARNRIDDRLPDAIFAPRSTLIELSRRVAPDHLPAALFSTGEPLHDRHRRHLESAFGVPVRNCYAVREVGPIAIECRKGALHVMAPAVRVEVVSDKGVNVADQAGRVVVTPLFNCAAPLLRLDVGDTATWRGFSACDCRWAMPVIELPAFPRRQMRTLELPDGRSVSIGFFEHRLTEAEDVVQWQVVRSGPAKLRLRLQPRHDARDPVPRTLADSLERAARDYLGREVDFRLEVTHRMIRSRTGRAEPLVDDPDEV